MQIYLESLGCARNQVDSETMLAQLASAGIGVTEEPSLAEAIVVNTCSFIEAAADESIDTIQALARYKREGRCRRLIVTGCLPERYRGQIVEALPEVDLFLGTGAYDQVVTAVRGGLASGVCLLPDPDSVDGAQVILRKPLQAHSAYLKIAEGCSRKCTYCIIPKLRGRRKSRPVDTILQEARALIAGGVRELTLVSQETTDYGLDLSPPYNLADLLAALARLDPTVWIRMMYGHPQSITPAMMQAMAAHANICSYIDLPIQHASPHILRRMGRHYTDRDLREGIAAIRAQVPDVALRTTVLVGFPGERESDFEHLKAFISEMRFDHLGVFAYSDAEDLPAHSLKGRVAAQLAQDRMDALMALQQDLSAENLSRYMGRQMTVLVDRGPDEDGRLTARTQYQAPEVDGVTYVHPAPDQPTPAPGTFLGVRVVDTLDYDLIAEVL